MCMFVYQRHVGTALPPRNYDAQLKSKQHCLNPLSRLADYPPHAQRPQLCKDTRALVRCTTSPESLASMKTCLRQTFSVMQATPNVSFFKKARQAFHYESHTYEIRERKTTVPLTGTSRGNTFWWESIVFLTGWRLTASLPKCLLLFGESLSHLFLLPLGM